MEQASKSSRTTLITIGVGSIVLLAAAAWLATKVADVGNGAVIYLGMVVWLIAGLFGSMAALSLLQRGKTPSIKANRRIFGICLLYTAALISAWWLAGTAFRHAVVHIDNFSGRNLTLTRNGEPWLDVDNGASRQSRLLHRKFEIKVKDSMTGELLDTMTIDVDSTGPFILNCLGAQKYEHGMIAYSNLGISSPFPTETSERWIRANVDYLFENPPRSIQAKQGEKAAGKTYILRKGK